MTEHRLITNLDFNLETFNDICRDSFDEKATEQELKAFVENCQTLSDCAWDFIYSELWNQFTQARADGMLKPEEEWEDEPEDVSCVGCGERVCGYEEEPPHKDSRDEAVCDDCYTPPEQKVWKFKKKKSPEEKKM